GFLTWRDANVAPPVYRADLTRPVVNAEHGKAVSVIPPWPVQGKSTARPAQGRRHGEDRISQGRAVMARIRPCRSGLSLSENRWNRTYGEEQMMIDACRLVQLRAGVRITVRFGRRGVRQRLLPINSGVT